MTIDFKHLKNLEISKSRSTNRVLNIYDFDSTMTFKREYRLKQNKNYQFEITRNYEISRFTNTKKQFFFTGVKQNSSLIMTFMAGTI
jgi:hypothetical protein